MNDFSCYFDPELFVQESSSAALIKDLSGKYIISNQKAADMFNITVQDVVGLNVCDLSDMMDYKNNDFIEPVAKLDYLAMSTGRRSQNSNRVLKTVGGFMRLEETIKIPVHSSQSKRVTAILTIAHDKTHTLTKLELLKLYLNEYNRKAAITKYLSYLKLDSFFSKTPSLREFQTLLVCAHSWRYEAVAEKMGITVKAVEKNIYAVRGKLHSPDLFPIIMELIKSE